MTIFEKMQKRPDSNPFLSLTDIIYEVVAEEIINYELLPESKLAVSAIAEECRTSRTPVTAAFDQLAKDGFLEQKGRTYIVKPFTTEDYLNYYFLRMELEAKAIRTACMRITPEELSKLKKRKTVLNRALAEKNRDAIIAGELQFHRSIVNYSANPFFISAYEALIPQIRRYAIYTVYNTEMHQAYMLQHDFICLAISVRNPDACESAIRAHLEKNEMTYEKNYLETKNSLLRSREQREKESGR